jgi:hypothetical protein
MKGHPFHNAHPKQKFLGGDMHGLMDNTIISPSNSSYTSLAVLIEKGNSKHKMVVDCRNVKQR